jgi:hypothetical protein
MVQQAKENRLLIPLLIKLVYNPLSRRSCPLSGGCLGPPAGSQRNNCPTRHLLRWQGQLDLYARGASRLGSTPNLFRLRLEPGTARFEVQVLVAFLVGEFSAKVDVQSSIYCLNHTRCASMPDDRGIRRPVYTVRAGCEVDVSLGAAHSTRNTRKRYTLMGCWGNFKKFILRSFWTAELSIWIRKFDRSLAHLLQCIAIQAV